MIELTQAGRIAFSPQRTETLSASPNLLSIVTKAAEKAVYIGAGITPGASLHDPLVRDALHVGTRNYCAHLCGITLGILLNEHADKFKRMGILLSEYPGRSDLGRWTRDSYFIIEGIDGKIYAGSPAVHETLKDGQPLVNIIVADNIEGAIEQIKTQREGWEWARPQYVDMHLPHILPTITEEAVLRDVKFIGFGYPDPEDDEPMEFPILERLDLNNRDQEIA